ncbi:hypothetical protein ZWY2020_028747 [Hordeum vulgare]|nr:hypothetical protein ZWY2020_028747 [Hordeum vulgare]
MEMEMATEAAAAAMDFNALSRRELQALCKLNGVRANTTNLAMVEALQSLPRDEVGPQATPAAREDQQQQQQQLGSLLPRSRRVSVKSPEAIRMDVEEGEDEAKRNFIKEIVRTPGVALRSTSRRPRATPALSQRSTRKTDKAVEVEASTAKRSTRKTARSKVMFDLDHEEEDSTALNEEKVLLDEKCDGPEEEEEEEQVTKLPEEGNSKADEPEQGDEVVSSVVPIESADKSCDNSKLDEVVEEATKLQEAAVEEEQKLASAERSVPLPAMEDSPILGVISKATPEPEEAINEDAFNSTAEAADVPNKMIPAAVTEKEEINSASEDKKVAVVEEEAINEDVFYSTAEAADVPNKMIPAAVTEKEVAGDDLKEDAFNSTVEASDVLNENMTPTDVTEKEVAADDFQEDAFNSTKMRVLRNMTLTEGSEEDDLSEYSCEEDDPSEYSCEEDDPSEYSSEEEDDLTKEDMQKVTDSAVVNFYSDEEEDLEDEDMQKANDSTEANFDSNEEEEDLKMPETVEEPKENEESGEEDDFSADLSSEFDDVELSDAETESPSSLVAVEGIHAAPASSAAKTVDSAITNMSLRKLKSALKDGLEAKTADSAITEELEESSEGSEVSQHVDTIVETLDKVAITEEKCPKQNAALTNMSLRKLKSALKEGLIAAKEGRSWSSPTTWQQGGAMS